MNTTIIGSTRRTIRLNNSDPSSPNSNTSSPMTDKSSTNKTMLLTNPKRKDVSQTRDPMRAQENSIKKSKALRDHVKEKKVYKTQKLLNSTNTTTTNKHSQISPQNKRKINQIEASVFLNSNKNLLYDYSNLTEEEFTPERFQLKSALFKSKLVDLEEKLCLLREIGLVLPARNDQFSQTQKEFLEAYSNEISQAEQKSGEHLQNVRLWYDRQRQEIEFVYEQESKKATQEFCDKRAELKESLRNEYEEMRKQIETDKQTLDINNDTAEVKAVPQRNLRRRANNNNNNNNNNNEMDNTLSVLDLTSNLTHHLTGANASLMLQTSLNSSSVNIGDTLASLNFHVLQAGFCTTSAFNATSSNSNNSNANSNSLAQGVGVGDRKRKVNNASAVISLALADDDLNDDYKSMVKMVKQHNKESHKEKELATNNCINSSSKATV